MAGRRSCAFRRGPARWRAERADEDAAFDKLVPEGGRTFLGGRGDDDAVEGGFFGPAERTVAGANKDVSIAQLLEPGVGLSGEVGVPLDRIDGGGQLGEDRGLVAAAGTDFQDFLGSPVSCKASVIMATMIGWLIV